MVQEFNVLRCFSCHTFQVHQVKKSRKWLCKLCGEKQSLVKVYGQGSAADCRHHVQKLNLLQGEVEYTADISAGLSWQNEVSANDNTQSSRSSQPHIETPVSCWSKYLEEDAENSSVKKEEEEENGLIYTDPGPFYKQKNFTSEGRKRKKTPQNAYGLKEEDFNRSTLYTSKKKRAWEEWTATKITDNPHNISNSIGSTGCHEKTMSPATDQPAFSKWERYVSTEEEVKENSSRTHICQKQAANMEATLNTFQHNLNTGPPLWFTQAKTSLESESHKSVHERKLLSGQSADCVPMPNNGSLLNKSSIFQTDEDFDENY